MNGATAAKEGVALALVTELAERTPGGFFIYQAYGEEKILYANDMVLDIFGCETWEEFQKLTGNTFPGMVHPDDLDAVQASIARQITEHRYNLDLVEYRIKRKDGQIRWIDDSGRLVHTEDNGDVFYVLIWDITEKRRETAKQLKTQLALEREKELNAQKSAFLFNISHDIRTPMNAIMGFTSLAKRHRHEPELLRDYLDRIDESSHYLLALIDDLLEMSEIDCGQVVINPEACLLEQEIERTLEMFLPQIEEKRLALEKDIDLPPGEVYLDPLRFRRILGNLLNNAVKFTPQGKITLKARQKSVSASGYGRYAITVTDTGIGMSEEFLGRMYEAFEREVTSTKTGYLGTGLGLTIIRRLLDLMGGSIQAESVKGKGSSFTVEIPLRLVVKDKKPLSLSPEASKQPTTASRILLVEDIEVNRMLAEAILQEAGFAVESVVDGCDAVEAVRKRPPGYYDLVLMDIQMPVMNGYEATRAIRALKRPDTDRLPIIALSANALPQDRAKSMESGMNNHVAKPFDIAHLIATINNYIAENK
ncbi:MAG: response regulator [Selenomonadaceae bacterium]|nr:response regulator [Selenomonadaceae bacterium]